MEVSHSLASERIFVLAHTSPPEEGNSNRTIWKARVKATIARVSSLEHTREISNFSERT